MQALGMVTAEIPEASASDIDQHSEATKGVIDSNSRRTSKDKPPEREPSPNKPDCIPPQFQCHSTGKRLSKNNWIGTYGQASWKKCRKEPQYGAAHALSSFRKEMEPPDALWTYNRECLSETHHTQAPFYIVNQIPPSNTYKTLLDAKDGYHAVELDEESRDFTTFLNECPT